MPTRSLGSRGFEVAITVPESIARPLRILRGRTRSSAPPRIDNGVPQSPGVPDPPVPSDEVPAPRLRLRDVPELRAAKRDPQAALAFLSEFGDKSAEAREGDRSRARPVPGSDAVPSPAPSLADAVAELPWYHTIELPGGVVSRGMFDHRPLVPHYGIPATLANKRCLDVACSNGFWAFEFERRGGHVTAVDIRSWTDWDLPTGAPVPFAGSEETNQSEAERPAASMAGDQFDLARSALNSRVERVRQNLYDLDPDELGTFDFVHAGDVLLHLARPLDGLRSMRRVTADGGTALIADVIDPTLSDPTLTRYMGGFANLHWWMPSLDCLAQMVYDAGFSEVEIVTIYNLAPWDLPEGFWRAVLRARP